MAINGYSPLHLAAVRNDLKAVEILLQNGADHTLTTPIDDYCTATEEAKHLGNLKAYQFITDYQKSKRKHIRNKKWIK